MPNITNLESTGIRRYARLANKTQNKYALIGELSLEVIGECDVAKNPQIFLTIPNQNIQ